MGMLKFVIFTSVLVIGLSYLLDDPIPDGLEAGVQIKVALGLNKAAGLISKFSRHLGMQEEVVFRNLVALLFYLQPSDQRKDIEVTKLVFASVPVRMYKPTIVDSNKRSRGLVFYHGGGWNIGNLDDYESLCKDFSRMLHAVVVSVDYRLAPEHVYPAAVDDCEQATLHFIHHAQDYGVDANRVAVMGDSAGGNLAAAVAIRLRDRKSNPQPKLQVLIYPITQVLDFDTPSYRANQHGPSIYKYVMTLCSASYLFGSDGHKYISQLSLNNHTTPIIKKSNAKTYMYINDLPNDDFVKDYKPNLEHGDLELWNKVKDKVMNPSLSPLFTPDLTGVPHAYVTTCQQDILRDDGILYAQRLRHAGVKVESINLELCFHGWAGFRNDVPIFNKEFDKLIKYINDNL